MGCVCPRDAIATTRSFLYPTCLPISEETPPDTDNCLHVTANDDLTCRVPPDTSTGDPRTLHVISHASPQSAHNVPQILLSSSASFLFPPLADRATEAKPTLHCRVTALYRRDRRWMFHGILTNYSMPCNTCDTCRTFCKATATIPVQPRIYICTTPISRSILCRSPAKLHNRQGIRSQLCLRWGYCSLEYSTEFSVQLVDCQATT